MARMMTLPRRVYPWLSVQRQSSSRGWLHRAFLCKRHQMRHLCDLTCLLAKQVLSSRGSCGHALQAIVLSRAYGACVQINSPQLSVHSVQPGLSDRGVSSRSVHRIAKENSIVDINDAAERSHDGIIGVRYERFR